MVEVHRHLYWWYSTDFLFVFVVHWKCLQNPSKGIWTSTMSFLSRLEHAMVFALIHGGGGEEVVRRRGMDALYSLY